MSAQETHGNRGDCALCDGPCRTPLTLPPIHDTYPFLPPEVAAMTQSDTDEPETPAEPSPARGRRRGDNRARHLEDHNARTPSEDR